MENLDISSITQEHDQSGFVFKQQEQASLASALFKQGNDLVSTPLARRYSPDPRFSEQQSKLQTLPSAAGNAQLPPPSYRRDTSQNAKKNRQPIFGGKGSSRNTSIGDSEKRRNSFCGQDGQDQSSFIVNLGNTGDQSFLSSIVDSKIPQFEYSSQPFSVKSQQSQLPKAQPYTISEQSSSAIGNSFERDTQRKSRAETQNNDNNTSQGECPSMDRTINRVGSTQNVKKRFQRSNSPVVAVLKKGDSSRIIESEETKSEMMKYAQDYFALLKADILNNSRKVNDTLKEIEKFPLNKSDDASIVAKLNKIEFEAHQLAETARMIRSSIKISVEQRVQEVVSQKIGSMQHEFDEKLQITTEKLNNKIKSAQFSQPELGKSLTESGAFSKNFKKELAEKASKSDVESVVNQKSADLWNRLGGLKEEIKSLEVAVQIEQNQNQKIEKLMESYIKMRDHKVENALQDVHQIATLHHKLSEDVQNKQNSVSKRKMIEEEQLKSFEQRIKDIETRQPQINKSQQKGDNFGKVEHLENQLKRLSQMFKEAEIDNKAKIQQFQKENQEKLNHELGLLAEERRKTEYERLKFEEERMILQEERTKLYSQTGGARPDFIFKIRKAKMQQSFLGQKDPNKNKDLAVAASQNQFNLATNQSLNSKINTLGSQQLNSDVFNVQTSVIPHPLLKHFNPLEMQLLSPFRSPPSPQTDQLFRSSTSSISNQDQNNQLNAAQYSIPIKYQNKDSYNISKDSLTQQSNLFRDSDPFHFSVSEVSVKYKTNSALQIPIGGVTTNQPQGKGTQYSHQYKDTINEQTEHTFISENQSNFMNQQAQSLLDKSKKVSLQNNISPKQNPMIEANKSIKLSPNSSEIGKSNKIIEEASFKNQNEVYSSSQQGKYEPQYSSKINYKQVESGQQGRKNIDQELLHSYNPKVSQNVEDILEQFEDFNENNIQLESAIKEDIYYDDEEDEEQNIEVNNIEEEEEQLKKFPSLLSNCRDANLIQIAEEEECDEDSRLGISASFLPQEKQILTSSQANLIGNLAQAKSNQSRQKVISQVEGLLQTKGIKKLSCLRDEAGYLKDAKGFYVFDSEGRMIKSDKETFSYLISQGIIDSSSI